MTRKRFKPVFNTLTKAVFIYSVLASGATFANMTEDEAAYVSTPPVIDGIADDDAWKDVKWNVMSSQMWGTLPEATDFSGRYKLRWDERALYLLAEIQDDHLSDTYADPLERYWDDDSLEIFIDADGSGGDHFNNYNAFAYHLALDNQVVDIGPDENGDAVAQLYNDHVDSAWKRDLTPPFLVYWEAAIRVFDDSYQHGKDNSPLTLKKGMQLGFMLAYCDADGKDREHFMGSHEITPVNGDKNLGFKDASVFGKLILKGR